MSTTVMTDYETGEIVSKIDLDKLTAPFPISARKVRKGAGNRDFTYVDGTTVIHRLIDATGNKYSFSVDKYWSQDGARLALVTLTIPGLGSRSHIGIQAEQQGQGEDALAKGSITDGLKKAATLFGVGLELYGPDLNAGEAQAGQYPANAPTPMRQPQGTAIDRVREVAGAHTLDVREGSKPSPRAERAAQQAPEQTAYPYETVFKRTANMADVNNYMATVKMRGGNMGEAIKAVNAYGRRVHQLDYDIVVGSGEYQQDYNSNKVFPADIGNALAHWKKQESLGGAEEAQEAAERDTANDDDWDSSVPF